MEKFENNVGLRKTFSTGILDIWHKQKIKRIFNFFITFYKFN